jgi:hypothetical protein
MATFAPGDDVDGYCGECGQVHGDVILVTVQGSEKIVTVRSVTGEEKMRGVKRDRFASEA